LTEDTIVRVPEKPEYNASELCLGHLTESDLINLIFVPLVVRVGHRFQKLLVAPGAAHVFGFQQLNDTLYWQPEINAGDNMFAA